MAVEECGGRLNKAGKAEQIQKFLTSCDAIVNVPELEQKSFCKAVQASLELLRSMDLGKDSLEEDGKAQVQCLVLILLEFLHIVLSTKEAVDDELAGVIAFLKMTQALLSGQPDSDRAIVAVESGFDMVDVYWATKKSLEEMDETASADTVFEKLQILQKKKLRFEAHMKEVAQSAQLEALKDLESYIEDVATIIDDNPEGVAHNKQAGGGDGLQSSQ